MLKTNKSYKYQAARFLQAAKGCLEKVELIYPSGNLKTSLVGKERSPRSNNASFLAGRPAARSQRHVGHLQHNYGNELKGKSGNLT